MSREADASTLRAFRWTQPSWQPDCNQERPDPQPAYFCTCFEQRHWGTLFQTTLQRFLMWTILENRGTNSLWRRGKVGLPSSLINKHLPQEQRLGGLVAGLSKRLGFPKFGVPQLCFNPTVCTWPTQACCHTALVGCGGQGKPVSPRSPRYLQCCNLLQCFVSDPGVSSLLPAPMKLGLATRYLQEG